MELLQFARSRRGGELIGIVILADGICLALALLTYHPDDSSAFYTSTNSVVANWIGYYGATIAWLFVGFFGFASLLFPGALLVAGWNRVCAKEIEYLQTKAIGLVILIAGAVQLTPWKAHHLARCREAPGQSCTLLGDAGSAWRQGMRFGFRCSLSCANLTAILLPIGVMDLRAMALVTAAITAERLAPAGERVAQGTGTFAIVAGLLFIARATVLA